MAFQSSVVRKVEKKKFLDYQRNQIMSLNPTQLLIKVYDYGILNSKKGDIDKTSKALVELISALNFDYQEIALGLFRLYQFCLDRVKKGEFEETIKILTRLRETWTKTLN